jgi:peptide deformylase
MSILKIARLGHPVLRKPAAPRSEKELKDNRIQTLIDDMVASMREYDGVGLAANQVHHSKQILVIESRKNPRYEDVKDIPLTILVNPTIVWYSDEVKEDWEGCLSVPYLKGKVERSMAIEVKAFDRKMQKNDFKTEGFLSVVIQHEMDHLNGKVFLDRMKDLSTLTHLEEFGRYWV